MLENMRAKNADSHGYLDWYEQAMAGVDGAAEDCYYYPYRGEFDLKATDERNWAKRRAFAAGSLPTQYELLQIPYRG